MLVHIFFLSLYLVNASSVRVLAGILSRQKNLAVTTQAYLLQVSNLQRQSKESAKHHAAVRDLAREWERRAVQRADLMNQLTAAHKALQQQAAEGSDKFDQTYELLTAREAELKSAGQELEAVRAEGLALAEQLAAAQQVWFPISLYSILWRFCNKFFIVR